MVVFAYSVLIILAVPWYWPEGSVGHLFGIPYWVLSSLFFGFICSLLTIYLLLFSDFGQSESDPG